MEERSWVRRDDREMHFSVLKESRGRFWTGFQARIYETTAGFDETLFVNHNISMHVGPPVLVTTRCDGSVLHRLQVPGDLKIIPSGFSRVWEIERPTLKLSILVSPSLLRTAAERMGINSARVALAPQLQLRDPQIEHIGWAIKNELESDQPLGPLYADSLGLALAAHLVRRYAPRSAPHVATGLSKRQLRRTIDYIRDNLANRLTVLELADIVNVSPSHFNLLFRQAIGLSAHQYVIRTRVEYAIHLLLNDKLALSEVALRAGFANQSHMANCMHRVAGVTPGALRRSAT